MGILRKILDFVKENKILTFFWAYFIFTIPIKIYIENHYTKLDLDLFEMNYYWISICITFLISIVIFYFNYFSNLKSNIELSRIKKYVLGIVNLIFLIYFVSKYFTYPFLMGINLTVCQQETEKEYYIVTYPFNHAVYSLNENKVMIPSHLVKDTLGIGISFDEKFKQGDTFSQTFHKGLLGINYIEK